MTLPSHTRWFSNQLVPIVMGLSLLLLLSPSASAFENEADTTLDAPGNGPVVCTDLNGDSVLDIVAVDSTGGKIWVWYQPFEGGPDVEIRTTEPMGVAVTEVSGDEMNDMVVYNNAEISTFSKDFDGYRLSAKLPLASIRDLAVGDLNADSMDELIAVTDDGLVIFWQRPLFERFSSDDTTYLPYGGDSVAVGDFDSNGEVDLAVSSAERIAILFKQGGLFSPHVVVLGGSYTRSTLVSSDVNGDGSDDIVLIRTDGQRGEAQVYLQSSSSAFNDPWLTFEDSFAGRIAVGDLFKDGTMDVALATIEGAIQIQRLVEDDGALRLGVREILDPESPTDELFLAAGDLNQDGYDDLVVRMDGYVRIYMQEDELPKLVTEIPSGVLVEEGEESEGVLLLTEYFSDDHGYLEFRIVYEEFPQDVHATVEDGLLNINASAGWTGSATFAVEAWDGVAGHPWVRSNNFSILVNDPPRITSGPPLKVGLGDEFSYRIEAEDRFPVDGSLHFSILSGPEGAAVDENGYVRWTPQEAGAYRVRVRVTDAFGAYDDQEFVLSVYEEPVPLIDPTLAVTAGTLTILGFACAAIAANENLKYSFLLFFLPLYTKIRREKVLDHFVRGQIYGYILANPGEHYNAIKQALGLTNGCLAHHLRTLEREEFIKSKKFGLYRRFYPIHMRVPEDGFELNEIQKTIVEIITERPGISQVEIAKSLNITPPTVNYHIGALSQRGMIRVIRRGRRTRCYVNPSALSKRRSS